MCSIDDCAPAMVVGRGLMCFGDVLPRFFGSRFVGLSSWVWVYESAFMDHRRDRRGLLS